jgi:hypothetical protein
LDEGQGSVGEWADLISSRLGSASIVCPSDLGSPLFGVSDRRARARVSSMSTQRHVETSIQEVSIEAHRPSAVISPPESAVLHGGNAASSIAQSIATRTLWRAECCSDTHDDGAWLGWRGARWRIGAIDGWERSLPPWYSRPESAECASERGRSTWNACVDPQVHFAGVLSRIALLIRDGWLWILARWPGRLSVPQEMQSGSRGSCFASPTARAQRWFSGSGLAIQHGVDIDVLGIWA